MYIRLGDRKIKYFDNQVESDTTLLFIHGNSHSLKTFEHQFDDSELKRNRIIAYDLYGHGLSDRLESYNIQAFTEQLIQLCHKLQLKNIIIIGHSLGGHIAIQASPKLKAKLKGLFLFGTPPLENPLTQPPFKDLPETLFLSQENLTAQEAQSIKDFLYNKNDHTFNFEIKDILKTHSLFRKTFIPTVLAGDYQDEINILKNFKGPLRLYLGEFDKVISHHYIHQRFPKELHCISKASHNIHISNPKKFKDALLAFL